MRQEGQRALTARSRRTKKFHAASPLALPRQKIQGSLVFTAIYQTYFLAPLRRTFRCHSGQIFRIKATFILLLCSLKSKLKGLPWNMDSILSSITKQGPWHLAPHTSPSETVLRVPEAALLVHTGMPTLPLSYGQTLHMRPWGPMPLWTSVSLFFYKKLRFT